MKNLAIFLLTIATASEAQIVPDGFDIGKRSFNESMSKSRKRITRSYEAVKTAVDEVILQMEFKRPYVAPDWTIHGDKTRKPNAFSPPSGECYKYLKECREKNNTLLTQCSVEKLQEARECPALLEKIMESANESLKNKTEEAKNCETWLDARVAKNWVAILCIDGLRNKLPEIVAEANSQFSQLRSKVDRLLNIWIPAAGLCASDSAEVSKWCSACQDNAKFVATLDPTMHQRLYPGNSSVPEPVQLCSG